MFTLPPDPASIAPTPVPPSARTAPAIAKIPPRKRIAPPPTAPAEQQEFVPAPPVPRSNGSEIDPYMALVTPPLTSPPKPPYEADAPGVGPPFAVLPTVRPRLSSFFVLLPSALT